MCREPLILLCGVVIRKESWRAGQSLLYIDKTEDRPVSGTKALVAELVDALVSGTSGESRGGSSPLLGTKHISTAVQIRPKTLIK
jgi:hypothetical protein